MSLQEMTRVEQENLIHTAEDIYDDGFLRVEHKNYYVACGGSPIKLPRTEFLIFCDSREHRIASSRPMSSGVQSGEGTSRSILKACTFTSIACGRSSPISDCRSRRWLTSVTG